MVMAAKQISVLNPFQLEVGVTVIRVRHRHVIIHRLHLLHLHRRRQ
jgi:hypothetical protein